MTKRGVELIEMLPVEALKPYGRNPRQHSEAQVQAIVNSIEKFGFVMPILIDENEVIIAGHGRLRAAIMLGMKQVPCARIYDLTENEKRALIVADNQLVLLGAWDISLLASEIQEIAQDGIDPSLLGFSDEELARIERVGAAQDDPDEAGREYSVTCPECGHEFNPRA